MAERCEIYNRSFPAEEVLDPKAPLHEQIEALKKVMNSLFNDPTI